MPAATTSPRGARAATGRSRAIRALALRASRSGPSSIPLAWESTATGSPRSHAASAARSPPSSADPMDGGRRRIASSQMALEGDIHGEEDG